MNDSKIPIRYAEALFQAALEKKVLDRVNKDMLFISGICKIKEATELLHNPVIVPSKKAEILDKILGNNVEPVTLSLINLVVRNGREAYIPAIARAFKRKAMKHNGITESVLTTAVKVNPGIKKQIEDYITNAFSTRVEIQEIIDSELVGGFILRIDDKYIDASVRNKLRKIKKELKGSILPS